MVSEVNSISFEELIVKLRHSLKQKLPCEIAHNKMAASSRNFVPNQPNNFTKKSAVLILFYYNGNEIKVPVILRPPYDGTHGGQVAFPGGRIEKIDENLTRTALREAQEEIGIRTTDVEVIGQLSELYIPPSNFLVQPIVGFMRSKPVFYPDPREVEAIFEISFSDLIDPANISLESIKISGVEIEAPTYTFQNLKIWGATAMMIAELLMIIDRFEV
jgi:8-oxo-dGTP pyrophosphatase MutT (NUDIX family)